MFSPGVDKPGLVVPEEEKPEEVEVPSWLGVCLGESGAVTTIGFADDVISPEAVGSVLGAGGL